MSKIDLVPITGAQQLSAINDNFRKVEDALNDKVLYRDNPSGEANQVVSDIDMNGKRIYNLPQPQSPSEPVRYQDLGDVTALTEEARGYAEAAEASATVATDSAAAASASATTASNHVATAQQAVTDAEAQAASAAGSATASANSAVDAANSAAQAANKVTKTSDTGSAVIPAGTDAQRDADGTPINGWAHFSNERQRLEVFNGTQWMSTGDPEAISDLNTRVDDLTTALNDLDGSLDFTIIYPNGGTQAAPANVAINSRYVMANPFPGHAVVCLAEILLSGKWGATGYTYLSGTGGHMAIASQLADDIVLQTGLGGLTTQSNASGNPHGIVTNITTPTPCRIKVWEMKGNIV